MVCHIQSTYSCNSEPIRRRYTLAAKMCKNVQSANADLLRVDERRLREFVRFVLSTADPL